MARRYVVVGASGILAPLGRMLSGPGVCTVGISRGGRLEQGEWDERVALDARDADAIRAFQDGGPFAEAVIAYEPAVSVETWRVLAHGARRRVIILPSRFAAPRSGARRSPWLEPGEVTELQLGWTGPLDEPRWHTPAEVSAQALEALGSVGGSRLVLGRIVPWSDRPR